MEEGPETVLRATAGEGFANSNELWTFPFGDGTYG